MCKSFKLTRTECLTRVLPLLPLLVASAVSWATAQDQPSPSPATQAALGYVRFWNMLPQKVAPTLELLSAENKVLTTAPSYNYTANYTAVPAATYNFVVRKPGDTVNPLKKQSVLLRANTFITFLASENNGKIAVELIDDTLDPKKANEPAQITVRQFTPGARAVVSTKDGKTTPELGNDEVATLDGLPRADILLSMRATGLGPEPKMWSTEADLTYARHATLLVVADPYGRFRPRLAFDGQLGSKPAPTPPPTPKP